MPIYEYRCDSCGEKLEKMQKVSDSPLSQCPACGKSALVKLISPSGFRLKGSGWYETDFKKENRRNVVGDDAGTSSSSSSSSSDGDKTKPDAGGGKTTGDGIGEKGKASTTAG